MVATAPAGLSVVTFNVMFELLARPDVPPWESRREAVVAALRAARADAIGLQETSPAQVDFIRRALPGYDLWSHPVRMPEPLLSELRARYGHALSEEFSEVVLLTARETITVEAQFHWWLSPTPDVELSTGFGKPVPRLALGVRAVHRPTGVPLGLVTTHVDATAPFEMTAVLLTRLKPEVEAGRSVVLFGDLNSDRDPHGVAMMLSAGWRDAYAAAASPAERGATTWIGDRTRPAARIDHVLYCSAVLRPRRWQTLGGGAASVRLSDHAPLLATFDMPGVDSQA